MPLLEELEASGNWLFRWRSYLPLIFTVAIFAALSSFRYPFGSHLLDQVWELICLGVSLSGLFVRAITVGCAAGNTSGRNTAGQVADALNTTGMYSVARNPLYLGNFLMVLGVVIFYRVWWLPLLYILLFAIYYERIIFAEEMYLRRKFGDEYLEWASRTPLFFPKFSQWRPPAQPISWRKILRREYHGAFGLIVAFFILEAAGDFALGEGLVVDRMWRSMLAIGFAAYIVLRFLHKHTSLLKDL